MLLATVSMLMSVQEVKAGRDSVSLRRQQKEQKEQKEQKQKTQEQNARDQFLNVDKAGEESQSRLGGDAGERVNGTGKQLKTSGDGKTGLQPRDGSTGTVKKIQGARPDWSRAKGARPASIERPAGSRIPKGAGRPAGARGPGRR